MEKLAHPPAKIALKEGMSHTYCAVSRVPLSVQKKAFYIRSKTPVKLQPPALPTYVIWRPKRNMIFAYNTDKHIKV